jgi:large subunit ribosomal protein L25
VIDRAGQFLAPRPEIRSAAFVIPRPGPRVRSDEENSMAEKITAETRTEFGKGAARRIRREDKVPAVIYGHGNEPLHISLPGHDAMMALKHGGANALLEIEIDGKTQLGLTKQIQVDPITRFLEHIDFVAVRKGEKVTVDVPVHVVGEAGPDTLVVTENTTISLEAEATHIPEFIEVSIEGAGVGTQLLASQLDLPSGSTLLTDDDMLIVNVTNAPTEEEIEAELEEAEAEVGIEREESDAEVAEREEAEQAEAAEGEGAEAEAGAGSEGSDEE